MPTTEIAVVDADENQIVESTAILAEDRARYFEVIRDDRHLEECGASIREIDAATSFIGSVYDYVCAEANKLHKKFTGQRKATKAPFEDAKRLRTLACKKYVFFKDEAAHIERDKIQEATLKEAVAACAEQVVALTEAGDTEAAKAVREAPVVVYTPPPVAVAKPVGVVFTKHSKFKVVNAALIPLEWWMLDEKKIGAHGRKHKEAASIPGVRFSYE